MSILDLNAIAAKQFDWVERMGWHNKTVLEALALIASEIGEAAGELTDNKPSRVFGEELADIVLRTADLAHWQKIDLAAATNWSERFFSGRTPLENIAELMVAMARWINAARQNELGHEFEEGMGDVMRGVMMLAADNGVDLYAEVHRKMSINEMRGTRGRRI